tara:strand:- start:218 stop:1240 length:1023 start_codon:yes stop_codon:yes gene_type:complete
MTQDNTYQRPSLFIGNKEILADFSGSFSVNGNNQLNTLSVKIQNPELQNLAIHNKVVELFLNNGTHDSLPIFRGYVNNFVPDDRGISIQASDIRIKYTGKKGLRLTLTDTNNYDGYSLGQFLIAFTDDFVSDVNITSKFITDTSPKVYMTGERGIDEDVYTFLRKKVEEAVDDDDFLVPLTHFIDVYDDVEQSSVVIKKEKSLTDSPVMVFSYADGLSSYKYNRRLPANTATFEGRQVSYTNKPEGTSSISVPKQDSPAETRNLGLRNILISQQARDEITVNVTKGYDLNLGEIVSLDVEDEDIAGNHRVQGKTISFGKTTSCTLRLNKKPVVLSEFISS